MKKILFLSLVAYGLYYGLALAQTPPPPVPSPLPGFDIKVFLTMVLANGGLTLLRFVCGYIPVVGPYIQKLLDILMANPAHPATP